MKAEEYKKMRHEQILSTMTNIFEDIEADLTREYVTYPLNNMQHACLVEEGFNLVPNKEGNPGIYNIHW